MQVTLRKPRIGDAEARAAFGLHPDVLAGFGVAIEAPAPMPLAQAEKWIALVERGPYGWIIEHNGKLAGEIRLDNFNSDDRRASLAVGIVDPAKLGQGLGREAIKICLRIAFSELKLHRVSVRVLASNLRAIRCYEGCGFKKEGIEREAALTDSGWQDDMLMGILAAEFV